MFVTDPGMVPLPGYPDLFYLDGPLVWSDKLGTIAVPAGVISDDASIPKFLDWIPFLDRQGLSRRPGFLHDALYSLGRLKGKDFADNMLQAACMAEGMSQRDANWIYLGVHDFGQQGWDTDAPNEDGVVGVRIGNFIDSAHLAAWSHTLFGAGYV